MDLRCLAVLAVAACAPARVAALASAVLDECPAFVVDVDNRAAFQCALDRGMLDLRGAPGRYYVDTPPWPRPLAMLSIPDDALVVGDGAETIEWRGDPMGIDWRGIQPHNRGRITGVTLQLTDVTGAWDEQSHLVELVGPLTGFEMDHVTMIYPVMDGVSRGDDVRIRCYPESRCWDVHVHHSTFASSARSGVSIHSGLHGSRLPDGSCSTRFDHNEFDHISDQDLDIEGSGDVGGIDDNDCVEWDHNIHRASPPVLTSLAVSLYPSSVEVHHNLLLGRGLDILGGSHRIHHNVITQSVPNGGTPVVYERKAGSSWFADELWTREASAGAGGIFGVEQKLSAPSDIRLNDVRMVQHTASGAIVVRGVSGFTMRDVTVTDDGLSAPRDAIRVEGTNNQSNGTPGTRTTPVVVMDSVVTGPFRALVSTSGYYAGGVGSFELRNNTASSSSTSGFRCEDVTATATAGGVSGPIAYADNKAGAPSCSPWSFP